nr:granzyme B-like [Camelus dromedarius]
MAEKNAVLKREPVGEIIGGHEAKPHSPPPTWRIFRSGSGCPEQVWRFLIREDFVLTAAHCWGSSINDPGGPQHQEAERDPAGDSVRKAIRHPDYNKRNYANDIMLLQVEGNLRDSLALVEKHVLPSDCNQSLSSPPVLAADLSRGSAAEKGQADGSCEAPSRLPGDRARGSRTGVRCGWLGRVAVAMNNIPRHTAGGGLRGPSRVDNVAQGIVSYGQNDGSTPRACTKVQVSCPG